MIFSGKAPTQIVTQGGSTDAEVAGATIGAGLVSFVTGGVSVVMALVCLLAFAVSYWHCHVKCSNLDLVISV